MSITSSFINDKSNPFSLKITKLLKISMYLPVINIIVGLSKNNERSINKRN